MGYVKVEGNFSDEKGNKVTAPIGLSEVYVAFEGRNNTLYISESSRLRKTKVHFPNDGGYCVFGNNIENKSFMGQINVGFECKVVIEDDVTSQGAVYLTTAERVKVTIGRDSMLSDRIQIRAEDSHAIYDVNTGSRLNPSKDVFIGKHVWLGYQSTILSGTVIRDGSVIGFGAVVKGNFPNNVVLAGVPAKIVKKYVSWERPHLFHTRPWVKAHIDDVGQTVEFWNKTLDL